MRRIYDVIDADNVGQFYNVQSFFFLSANNYHRRVRQSLIDVYIGENLIKILSRAGAREIRSDNNLKQLCGGVSS